MLPRMLPKMPQIRLRLTSEDALKDGASAGAVKDDVGEDDTA